MKKEFVVVSFAFLVLMFFIVSVLYIRKSNYSVESYFEKIGNINFGQSKKNFENTQFLLSNQDYGYIENCEVAAIANLNNLKRVTNLTPTPGLERVVYEQIEKPIDKTSTKTAGFDVMCIEFDKSLTQLKNTLESADKKDPTILKKTFGETKDELLNKDPKDLYRIFFSKRSQKNECIIKDKVQDSQYIQTKLEKRLDSKYIDCTFEEKDAQGVIIRKINVDYLFFNDNKYILQIGTASPDVVSKDLLLVNNE